MKTNHRPTEVIQPLIFGSQTPRNAYQLFTTLVGFSSDLLPTQTMTIQQLHKLYMERMNPEASPEIARLQSLRWQLREMIVYFESETPRLLREVKTRVHSTLEQMTQEAMLPSLRSLYADLFALEKVHQLNKAIPEAEGLNRLAIRIRQSMKRDIEPETESANHSVFALTIPSNPLLDTPAGVQESADTFILARDILPETSAEFRIIAEGIYEGKNESLNRQWGGALEDQDRYAILRKYVTNDSPHNSIRNLSRFIRNTEIKVAAKRHNQLKGKAATSRSLIINGDIPKPTPTNALGWYDICGLGLFEAPNLGEGPAYYLCFTAPMLPMTQEHRSMGAIMDGSGTMNHSLPSRSPGHKRGPNGGIDYGVWRAYCCHINKHGASFESQIDYLSGQTHPKEIQTILMQYLTPSHGGFKYSNRFGHYNPALNLQKTDWIDPFMENSYDYESVYWFDEAGDQSPFLFIDFPWRAMAKAGRLFRFDNAALANEWAMAFAEGIREYLFSNQWIFHLRLAAEAAQYELIDIDKVIAKAGAGRLNLEF